MKRKIVIIMGVVILLTLLNVSNMFITSGKAWYHGTPVADAGGPYSGTVGQSVEFDGSGSHAICSDPIDIVLYEWDFDGDGTWDRSVTSPTTTYIYSIADTYTVKLKVKDELGWWSNPNTTTATITSGDWNIKVDIHTEDYERYFDEGETIYFDGYVKNEPATELSPSVEYKVWITGGPIGQSPINEIIKQETIGPLGPGHSYNIKPCSWVADEYGSYLVHIEAYVEDVPQDYDDFWFRVRIPMEPGPPA